MPQKNLVIIGLVGVVVLAAIAFFVVLPMLSGSDNGADNAGSGTVKTASSGLSAQPGSQPSAAPKSGSTTTSAVTPDLAFTVRPTSMIPENYKVTFQAERNGINGIVTVTFAGGPGLNGIRDTTITITKSDGTVETKSWKPKQNGDSTTIQGSLQTDHLEAVANFYNGDQYRVLDQIFEYKKKN